jgi:hypothetical protein
MARKSSSKHFFDARYPWRSQPEGHPQLELSSFVLKALQNLLKEALEGALPTKHFKTPPP